MTSAMDPRRIRALLALLLLLLLLLCSVVGAQDLYGAGLSEGSSCTMEDGSAGKCIQLPRCPTRIREVQEGKRFSTSTGRCSFDNFVEIVCCPLAEVEGNGMLPPTTRRPVSRLTSPSPFVPRPTTRPMVIWTPDPRPVTTPSTTTTTAKGFDINEDIGNKLGLRPADVACQEFEGKLDQLVNPNIFGGENASKGEFPHMVALGYKNDNENPDLINYNCGGSLITVRHVLTAAHCVSNINNYVPVEVKVGAVNLNDNSVNVQNIKVSEIVAHPRYKRSLNYFDIAILKLERPAEVSQYVKPVCLQTKRLPNLGYLVNMSVVVTGWGATSFEDEGSNTLQKTPNLQLVERLECAESYKDFSKLPRGIDDSMICVLDRNVTRRSDACQGDSGGPLLLTKDTGPSTVLGVTSFGQSCGSSIPAIYSNVIFYLDWIEETVWPHRKRNLRGS